MKRLKVHKHTLHILKNCKSCLRKKIIKGASNELIKCLSEICQNIMNGNVPISKKCKNRLKKYKTGLRKIVSPEVKLHSKRNIFVQKGGFLPFLLTEILSGIVGASLNK